MLDEKYTGNGKVVLLAGGGMVGLLLRKRIAHS